MKSPLAGRLVLAVVAVAAATATPIVLEAVFHAAISSRALLGGTVAFLAFFLATALIFSAMDRDKLRPLKFFSLSWTFVAALVSVRTASLGVERLVLFGSIAPAAVITLWCTARLSETQWKRLAGLISTVGIASTLGPFLMALGPAGTPTNTFDVSALRTGGVDNYLIFVADELSPEYAGSIIQTLRRRDLHVVHREVESAGTETAEAIPSMLSATRFSGVTACCPTALCGASSLDFRSLRASSPSTDVVGFWLPYCSISGTRSCHNEAGVLFEDTALAFGYGILACKLAGRLLEGLQCGWRGQDDGRLEAASEHILGKAWQAPFWKQGGVMFVHYPLPHPRLGTYKGRSLQESYEANIERLRATIEGLSERLRVAHGKNFALIVTSDHALRVANWCDPRAGHHQDCAARLPADRGRVPLIVASPVPWQRELPDTNYGLLAAKAAEKPRMH